MSFSSISRAMRVRGTVALVVLALAGCGGGDSGDSVANPTFKALELNIAHINDHHSQLDANPSGSPVELKLDGVATQVDQGGFARQTAMFKSLAGSKNLLKIHAGDATTGTLYHTFFKGAADAAMMNSVCSGLTALSVSARWVASTFETKCIASEGFA